MSIRFSLLILRPDPTEDLVVQNAQQAQEAATADLINVQSSIVPADVTSLQEAVALVIIFDIPLMLESSNQRQYIPDIRITAAKGLISIHITLR